MLQILVVHLQSEFTPKAEYTFSTSNFVIISTDFEETDRSTVSSVILKDFPDQRIYKTPIWSP